MRRFFEEEEQQFDKGDPSFSFYDFKKWLSQHDSELKSFLDENADVRKQEEKEDLKSKFKKQFKEKLESKRKKKKKD